MNNKKIRYKMFVILDESLKDSYIDNEIIWDYRQRIIDRINDEFTSENKTGGKTGKGAVYDNVRKDMFYKKLFTLVGNDRLYIDSVLKELTSIFKSNAESNGNRKLVYYALNKIGYSNEVIAEFFGYHRTTIRKNYKNLLSEKVLYRSINKKIEKIDLLYDNYYK